jgi:adenine-specific DNA-methyltransferase
LVCDEVFGEENRVATIVWKNVTDNNPSRVAVEHEYILVYGRQIDRLDSVWQTRVSDIKSRLLEVQEWFLRLYSDAEERQAQYTKWLRENKAYLSPLDRYKYIDDRGIYTGSQSVHNPGREGYRYDVAHPVTGKPCKQPLMGYRFPPETMDHLLAEGKVIFGDDENKIIELKVYVEEYEEKLSSVITLDGRLGAYDLQEVFSELPRLFPNPKPVDLVTQLLSFVVGEGDLVLDFFAGTCTTAQSIVEMNSARSCNTRFVMVQLPEEVDDKTETGRNALDAGFHTIADIGKERIRRVVDRVQKKKGGSPGDVDTSVGFRVFRLDRSNYRPWDSSDATEPDAYSTQLELHVDPLVDGWKAEDVAWEVALKEGWGLDSRIESVTTVSDCAVHRVTSADGTRSFLICLNDRLSLEALRPLGLKQEDLFICRDCALTDESAANLALQCRLKTI